MTKFLNNTTFSVTIITSVTISNTITTTGMLFKFSVITLYMYIFSVVSGITTLSMIIATSTSKAYIADL